MTITTSMGEGRQSGQAPETPNSSKIIMSALLASGAGVAIYGLTHRGVARAALVATGGGLAYLGVAGYAKAYQANVRVSFTINRSPQEVYDFVRDASNWPRFLQSIEMQRAGDRDIKLVFGKPAGMQIESNAEITDEKPGDFIAWSSVPEEHGVLEHRGVIHFKPAPGNRGTEVSVALEAAAPVGPVARGLALFVGWDPEQLVRENMRRMKQLIEAGEIPTTEGQPSGARGVKGKTLRAMFREPITQAPPQAQQKVRLAGD